MIHSLCRRTPRCATPVHRYKSRTYSKSATGKTYSSSRSSRSLSPSELMGKIVKTESKFPSKYSGAAASLGQETAHQTAEANKKLRRLTASNLDQALSFFKELDLWTHWSLDVYVKLAVACSKAQRFTDFMLLIDDAVVNFPAAFSPILKQKLTESEYQRQQQELPVQLQDQNNPPSLTISDDSQNVAKSLLHDISRPPTTGLAGLREISKKYQILDAAQYFASILKECGQNLELVKDVHRELSLQKVKVDKNCFTQLVRAYERAGDKAKAELLQKKIQEQQQQKVQKKEE